MQPSLQALMEVDSSFSMAPQTNQMDTFMAKPEVVSNPGWIVDLGATNYCTPSASHLQTMSEYFGSQQVYMGDASGLNI